MDSDREHLRLLSIFHWIVAGMTALCSLFPLIHLAVGIALVTGRLENHGHEAAPRAFGWIFIFFATALILFGFTLAACLAFAGHFIAQHRNRTFCLVVAAFSCLCFPFGTALGVFTIIVLSRESVRALFEEGSRKPNLPGALSTS